MGHVMMNGGDDQKCNGPLPAISITYLVEEFAKLFKLRIEANHYGFDCLMALFKEMKVEQQFGIRLKAQNRDQRTAQEAGYFAKGHLKNYPGHYYHKKKVESRFRGTPF